MHFDGAFDAELLLADAGLDLDRLPESVASAWGEPIAVRAPVAACGADARAFAALTTCRGQRSLKAMIDCFEIFLPIARGRLALLETLACRFVENQALQGVVYTEVRYSPHLLCEGGELGGAPGAPSARAADAVVAAVTRGLRRGEAAFGVTVNQILCCLSMRPDWADGVVELAARWRGRAPCAVVGVDVAAGEEHFDARAHAALHAPHRAALARARKLGLPITLHAAEVPGEAANARAAAAEYGARRLGHGYQAAGDAALMAELVDLGVHFEVCPTSSYETGGWTGEAAERAPEPGWGEHPVHAMLAAGASVGLNSDDPSVFATSLSEEFEIAERRIGLSAAELQKCTRSAIAAAFVDDGEKRRLVELAERINGQVGAW